MHCIFFLRLEGFYASHWNETVPLVIHREKRVLDCNAFAESQKIWRGMPLSEAKAILEGGKFVAWEEEPYQHAAESWLDILCEYSDVIEPDDQHTAWVDLSLHPDAEALAVRIQKRLANEFGLAVYIGFGPSKWIAKLACVKNGAGQAGIAHEIAIREPIANAAAFLAPVKTRFLSPVEEAARSRLEFLGYRTIGEVAKVPLPVLRGQFGDYSTHILNCARGGFVQPVEPTYPRDALSDRILFDGEIEDAQVLDSALQELAVRLSKKLRQGDKQSKDLVVTLDLGNGELIQRNRKFTKPIHNYASVLSSLRLMMQPFPETPLSGVRARLLNVAQVKRVQQELGGRTERREREKGAMAAFQHVRTAFGDSAIQTGSEIVEPRRKQVLRAWRDATGWS